MVSERDQVRASLGRHLAKRAPPESPELGFTFKP